jgi:hypothetical protein
MGLYVVHYEGNTKNNGYVVFKCNIHGSAGKKGGGGERRRSYSARPLTPFYSKASEEIYKTP